MQIILLKFRKYNSYLQKNIFCFFILFASKIEKKT